MLNKRLAVISAVAVSMAVSGTAICAEQAKPTDTKKTPVAAVKPAQAKTAPQTTTKPAAKPATPAVKMIPVKPATNKATLEENLKKFKTAPDSAVIAVVNGENITKGDLASALWDWSAPQALEEYIHYKMVMQAAKKAGVTVTPADKDILVSALKRSSTEPVDNILQRMMYSRARWDAYVNIQTSMEKLTLKEYPVTDAELAEFIKARMIMVYTSAQTDNPKPDEIKLAQVTAQNKIDKVYTELKAGKSFEQAAKEYSDEPNGKLNGGDIGWIRKSSSLPELTDAAFNLKAGEFSAPIKTDFAFVIVKVEKLGKDASAADKADLEQQLRKPKVASKLGEIRTKLKQNSIIENYLCPTLPEVNKPMGNPSSTNTLNSTGSTSKPSLKRVEPSVPAGKDAPPTAPALKK